MAPIACLGGATDIDGSVDGTGGQSSCPSLPDVQGKLLNVVIKNERSDTIYIDPEDTTCGNIPLFFWGSLDHNIGFSQGHSCGFICEMIMEQGDAECFHPDICEGFESVALAPGETVIRPWSATFSKTETLAGGCYEAIDGSDEAISCIRRTPLPDGAYRFTARASTSITCGWGREEPCGSCVAEGRGCVLPLGVLTGEILEASTTLDLTNSIGADDSEPESILVTFSD